jgi:hypothetical protein
MAPKQRKGAITRRDELVNNYGDRRGLAGVGDGSRGLRVQAVGTFSKGTLYLSQRDINAVTSRTPASSGSNSNSRSNTGSVPESKKKKQPSWVRKAAKKNKRGGKRKR